MSVAPISQGKYCPTKRPLNRADALDAEVRAEQEKDRAYWVPLKHELEAFRRAEREGPARPEPGRLSQADPGGEA
jgi:hypothetical protein